ncbi:Polysaccharide deacetylase [Flexibacter flexilis DSM 6793]|uniref:Polysaccharide deacetylase n=1 Tax=Flexibacter flexilis DSM 6793 TaxID=927664 RepID=A0A1I1KKP7_9BACT|nr:polysaccharide deacetylase family protein [Flexibacter flexilis]SFC61135.1 Polysaccharide deacetylase [Flexibacter flexilis DSM 6793]
MKLTKTINRKIISPLVYGLGIEQMLARRAAKHRIILNYHGVTDKFDLGINHRHMDVQQFERDILYFKKHFKIVSLSEIYNSYLQGETPQENLLALTFDDGYINNLEIALPILEKYNAPATFYIITAGLENPDFITWYDTLDMMRLADHNAHNYGELANQIKKMGNGRDVYIQGLTAQLPRYEEMKKRNPHYWQLMNNAQVLTCAKSKLIEIGSHTHLHYNVGNIDFALASEEMRLSKKILENLLQKEIVSIAYPDGNYTDKIKDEAQQIGYKQQYAVNYQLGSDANDTRILNRWSMSNSTTHEANMILLSTSLNSKGF